MTTQRTRSLEFRAQFAAMKKRRGLSYGDLQIRTGISAGQLCNIVKGRRPASDAVIASVAEGLDVPPDHFHEYRLRAVCGMLERRPDYIDQLYAELHDVTPMSRRDNRVTPPRVHRESISPVPVEGQDLTETQAGSSCAHPRETPPDTAGRRNAAAAPALQTKGRV